LSDVQDVCFMARQQAIMSKQKTAVVFYPQEGKFAAEGATASSGKVASSTLPAGFHFAMLDIFRQDYAESEWARVFFYPDGTSDLIGVFGNLRQIENTTYAIAVGTTVKRQLHLGTTAPNATSRCNGLVWGYGVANDIAAGSDSVLVTRVDASTWHVASDPNHNLAWCKATGELFPMSVEFTLVASRALP